ncbi:MAG: hypothetical protein AAF743_14055 [Planctomycetota bacterium]
MSDQPASNANPARCHPERSRSISSCSLTDAVADPKRSFDCAQDDSAGRTLSARLGLNAQRLLIALVAIVLLVGCSERAEIVNVESQKEANRIVVELAAAGIWAEIVPVAVNRVTRYAVHVQPDDVFAARGLLMEQGLPADPHTGFESMIADTGLIPSRTDERAKLMHAMAGELAQTFELDDRVVRARVHIVLPEKDWMASDPDAQTKPSAVVFIKYRAAGPGKPDEPPFTAETARRIVAAGVDGLIDAADDDQRIAVVFSKAATAPPPADITAPAQLGVGPVEIVFIVAAVVAIAGFVGMSYARRPK